MGLVVGCFVFVLLFMFGKCLVVIILSNLYIYIQKGSCCFWVEFVEDCSVYEYSYLCNEGYVLGNGFLYVVVDEVVIILVKK